MTLVLLAQSSGTPTGPEFGKASPLGFLIILVLLVGTSVLIWSMNRHIKRLPANFERDHPEPDQEADDGTDHGIIRRADQSAAADRTESS
ncbi:hypothetical protein [Nocardia sp. CNY236]|uniref:hypothetical protein n=1 Tax=Nocardia sp. CNY236 TaxID=1169152 RepID=UPI000415E125|nr:hypothetical protein [Nocardia sp. CNY236]